MLAFGFFFLFADEYTWWHSTDSQFQSFLFFSYAVTLASAIYLCIGITLTHSLAHPLTSLLSLCRRDILADQVGAELVCVVPNSATGVPRGLVEYCDLWYWCHGRRRILGRLLVGQPRGLHGDSVHHPGVQPHRRLPVGSHGRKTSFQPVEAGQVLSVCCCYCLLYYLKLF